MDGPSPTSMISRARLAGAMAAIVSAFVVFVSGGIIVLSVWVSQEAEKQSTSVNQEVRKMIQAATKPEKEKSEKESGKSSPSSVEKPSPEKIKNTDRSERRSRSRSRLESKVRSPVDPEPEVSEEPTVVPKVEEEPEPGGRGNVMFLGDADRVRLLGSGMTFGAGSIPSGSYSIQATFPDSDPRNAGTLVVRDGDRLRVHCDATSKRCVRIK